MADAVLHYTEGTGTVHLIPRSHIQRITITPELDGTAHAILTVPPGPGSMPGSSADQVSLGFHDLDEITEWAEEFLRSMAGEIIRVPEPKRR